MENWEFQSFLDNLDENQRERVISQVNLYHHFVDDDYIDEDEIEELLLEEEL